MAKPSSPQVKRKPRLLWANPFCLMDTSSGASMTVRQMLLQLAANGYEIRILGATVFDNTKGMGRFKEQFPDITAQLHQLIEAEDGPLTHQLVVSYSHNRNHLTTHEEDLWYSQYLYLLDDFKPDLVWFYGGQTLDLLIADEARDRGIPTAFYLANGGYKAPRWCRDVDLILTDSQATADMYRKTVGYTAKPVGKFIDPSTFVAETHERKRLLFVNPSWPKGASLVVQLAEKLEQERPDIELEVVEARADWRAVVRETTHRMGKQRTSLSNVVVTPNTSDMRGPYSRARLLLAPSLWWESSGRVLAEAMLNGIPALITRRGGMPEMIDNGGIAFEFPETCYEEPYQTLLTEEELSPLFEAVVSLFDDEALYAEYIARAEKVGREKHHLEQATQRLLAALNPLANARAGSKDFQHVQKKRHRQRIAGRATKPEFKVDTSFQRLIGQARETETKSEGLYLHDDFTWQLTSKVIVIDNRARLLRNGLVDPMIETGAFAIVAFDPASEVKNAQQYEGSEDVQVFTHALLGDGEPTTLYACVAPEMTGTLKPLDADKLPPHHRLGAQALAELPINTIALDNITGLESLDWLILDDLSDASTILAHGKKALKDTLLIQATVSLQPTHERQPNLSDLQRWASRNGFRFYRFHDFRHHSHLPENLQERTDCATEQENAEALFLPSRERMEQLNDEQKTKLAFILSAVFKANDIAFELLSFNKDASLKLLEANKIIPKKTKLTTEAKLLESDGVTKKDVAVMMLSFGNRPWVTQTSTAARTYAENIGADFILIDTPPSSLELPLPILKEEIGRPNKEVYAYKLYFPWKYMHDFGYKRIFIIDDSTVIKPNSPNVFLEVPENKSGYAWSQPEEAMISLAGITSWLNSSKEDRVTALASSENFYRTFLYEKTDKYNTEEKVELQYSGGTLTLDISKYANTAAMVFDRSCMDTIAPQNIVNASDLLYSIQPNQTLWWYLISQKKTPVFKISSKWNWLLGWGLDTSQRRSIKDILSCDGFALAHAAHATSAYTYRHELITQMCNIAAQSISTKSYIEINKPDLFSQSLTKLIKSGRKTRIIQVGANDGKINDPIYEIVMNNKTRTCLALIEPQTNVIPFLKKNYAKHPDAKIVNKAIGKNEKLVIYRVKPEMYSIFIKRYLKDSPDYRVPSGFASFNRRHVEQHISGNLPSHIKMSDVIEELEIDSVNLQEIVKSLPWKNRFDVLQIDVEGMDDIVIYESSINIHKPKLINFEHAHLSPEKYSNLCKYLSDHGYRVHKYSNLDTLASL